MELIHEAAAHEMFGAIQTPPWRIGVTTDPDAVVRDYMTHLEEAFAEDVG
jgi:hypothetical protein